MEEEVEEEASEVERRAEGRRQYSAVRLLKAMFGEPDVHERQGAVVSEVERGVLASAAVCRAYKRRRHRLRRGIS